MDELLNKSLEKIPEGILGGISIGIIEEIPLELP